MWYLLIFCIALLGIGVFIDWRAKKNGLTNYDPEENAKHVSPSERAYAESYMNQMKDEHNNGGNGF